MTVLANANIQFGKKGQTPLPAFVRIEELDTSGDIAAHAVSRTFEMSFDAELQFPDGSRIDSTCYVIWDQLGKPAPLNLPSYHSLPYPHKIATFQDEQ